MSEPYLLACDACGESDEDCMHRLQVTWEDCCADCCHGWSHDPALVGRSPRLSSETTT